MLLLGNVYCPLCREVALSNFWEEPVVYIIEEFCQQFVGPYGIHVLNEMDVSECVFRPKKFPMMGVISYLHDRGILKHV